MSPLDIAPTTMALVLLFMGLVLLLLEFFIPSSGVLAVMCALSFLGAIVYGFMAGPYVGTGIVLVEVIVVPSAVAAAVKWWPETPIGRMILIGRPKAEEVLPQTEAYRGLQGLIGKQGTAKGTMLPSGTVVIDGKSYDAVSEGVAIEAGQRVLVVQVSTQRLIVRPDTTIRAELVGSPLTARLADPLDQPIQDPFAE